MAQIDKYYNKLKLTLSKTWMKSQCSVFIMKSHVCVQFIIKSLVNLDKRNTNKGIVCIKNFDRSYIYVYYL